MGKRLKFYTEESPHSGNVIKNDWVLSKFCVYKYGNKYGLFNKNGDKITPAKYDFVSDKLIDTLYYQIKVNGKIGLIDRSGKEVVKPVYDNVIATSPGRILSVKVSEKWGFVDNKGKTLIKPQYDGAGRFLYSGTYTENKNGPFTLLDKELYCKIKLGKKWGMINSRGKIMIATKYDDIGELYNFYFINGYCKVKIGSKWGLIDKSGKTFIYPKYDDIGLFSDGLCSVKLNGKWGFISSMVLMIAMILSPKGKIMRLCLIMISVQCW